MIIKLLKTTSQAEKTKVMISEKSKLIKKHDKNLFNDVNMLKKRKVSLFYIFKTNLKFNF